MNSANKLLLLLFIIIGLSDILTGQDSTLKVFVYPRQDKVCIELKTKINISENLFVYGYEIKSLECSEQNIEDFRLEINAQIDSIQTPITWYSFYKNYLRDYLKLRYKIISFHSNDTLNDIKPMENLSGFKVFSTGLPTISKFFISGYVPWQMYAFSEDEWPDSIVYSDIFDLSYKGITVSPGNFSNEIAPIDLIDTLISYTDSSYTFDWVKDEPTYNKYNTYLTNAKNYLVQRDSSLARTELQKVLTDCVIDSSTVLTSEAFALLYYNTEFLISKLPETQTYPYLKVNFKDSEGNFILNGSLQYYDAGWKDAANNGDGTFNVETQKEKVSLRMTYEGGNQQLDNVTVAKNTVTFSTVKTIVKLLNSQNSLIDGGTIQYYASGWKEFGTATNGEAAKELLPKEYSFRMNYGGASLDKSQNIGTDATVIFQTTNAKVQLKDSQSNLLSGGTVQYYASGWKEFGTATNGEATKELLPKEYSFRMNYGGASLDKSQNIGTDATVIFQTTNAKVQLKDSQGNLLSGGTVQYYASGWKEFGTAVNGEAVKELLPKEYSFRMNYGGASLDKSQNIGTDLTVIFQTVNAKVQLKDSQGNLIGGGTVQYYASGWKEFGTATNGETAKELLPKEYSFRMNYGSASLDKSQNIGTDPTVIFQTVNTKVQLKDSQGNLLSGGTVQYYASGWKEFGTAVNGEAVKELLPKEYSFRMNYGGASLDKSQNISNNLPVVFSTVNCTVRVVNNANQPINNAAASYYASGWKTIGNTVNGEVIKELLPKNYSFRVNNNGVNKEKQQDITNNNVVEFVY